MAQLRDAHTSELIAEGTPNEIVTIADELGLKAGVLGPNDSLQDLGLDLLFDDVGLGFNADAVRKGRDENLTGLAGAAKEAASAATRAKGKPDAAGLREIADSLAEAAKAAKSEIEGAKPAAQKAKKALDKARARVKA